MAALSDTYTTIRTARISRPSQIIKNSETLQSLGVLVLSSHCQRTHFTVKPFAETVFGKIKLILGLQSQPELSGVAKET